MVCARGPVWVFWTAPHGRKTMSADVSLVVSCGAAVTSGAGPAFIRFAIIGRIAHRFRDEESVSCQRPAGVYPNEAMTALW
jgi:hypothetical protein